MDQHEASERIIRAHVLWAMGAGLIPIPLLDIAAVTAIQVDMLQQLAREHDMDFSQSSGKAYVTALAGGTLARLGASAVKIIPGIGTALGLVSMPILSGASTYAVGQVALRNFSNGVPITNIDIDDAKQAYKKAYEKGKSYVKDLDDKQDEAVDVYKSLEKLGDLRDKGLITEKEFEAKKQELLGRL